MHRRIIRTAVGDARVTLHPASDARAMVVLGHGAGGGVGAPDLAALSTELPAGGFSVALVEHPYLVAGRRGPDPAGKLDLAFRAAVQTIAVAPGTPLIVGGRSSGARVACRVAHTVGAAGVVALAFPLHPPGRPDRSRLAELARAGVPALVVQGDRDAFGRPTEFPALPGLEVMTAPGDHALRADPAYVAAAVLRWLADRCATRPVIGRESSPQNSCCRQA